MSSFLKSICLLVVCLSLVLTVVFVAFGQEELPVGQYEIEEWEKLTGKKITEFSEAPMLADLVKEGKLPPVEERISDEPAVVEPVEEIGQYGGTWRRAWTGPTDQSGIDRSIAYVRLVRWDMNGEVIPDLAKKFEMSSDGREFTFWLRKGLRWSDGQPFTVDDILFWFEDITLNKELTPVYPGWLTVEGQPAEIKKIDDYTFKITFDGPYPLFPIMHATQGGFIVPKHYLQQFHPKYASKEELDTMVKESGFQYWYQLFASKANDDWSHNPDLPVLTAWKLTGTPKEALIFERNPYYYKVDTDGNQLPYIDRVMNVLVQNPEVINMRLSAGEFDMQARHVRPFNYTLFMENREKGGYRVLKWKSGVGADPLICLNLSVKDPIKRDLFLDVRFRRALSLAINRDEINELYYLGLGTPMQAAIPSGMPYYDPIWEKAYAEYSPSEANLLLNELGLVERDEDGFRMLPDGKRLELTIEFTTDFPGVTTSDVAEMIRYYWQALGLKVALKPMERSLYVTRCEAGEVEIGLWYLDYCGNFLTRPDRLLGTAPDSPWAIAYAQWYISEGKSGEEPPQELKKLYEVWDRIKITVDSQERDRLIKEFTGLHRENLWLIGTVGAIPQIVVVKNNFRNVPENIIWDSAFRTPANAFPEQFFFENSL